MMKLLREIYLIPVHLYRWILSPLKGGPCCRYTPSCSTYFLEAVKKHGIAKGTILGLSRLSRCSNFFWGGNDPVPDVFSFRSIRENYILFRKPPRGFWSRFRRKKREPSSHSRCTRPQE